MQNDKNRDLIQTQLVAACHSI